MTTIEVPQGSLGACTQACTHTHQAGSGVHQIFVKKAAQLNSRAWCSFGANP